jgi:hypothetical protein
MSCWDEVECYVESIVFMYVTCLVMISGAGENRQTGKSPSWCEESDHKQQSRKTAQKEANLRWASDTPGMRPPLPMPNYLTKSGSGKSPLH